MPYTLTYRERMHGGRRKKYYGILRSPKDTWKTKLQAKKSRAFKRLRKGGYEPRVVKK